MNTIHWINLYTYKRVEHFVEPVSLPAIIYSPYHIVTRNNERPMFTSSPEKSQLSVVQKYKAGFDKIR